MRIARRGLRGRRRPHMRQRTDGIRGHSRAIWKVSIVRSFKVRMPESTFELIAREASAQGVSAAQYMREAALARVWFEHGIRHDETQTLARGILELARQADREGLTLEQAVGRLFRDDKPSP